MGVLIRYRDGRNYYRVSLDAAANIRRLVRCVDGTMTTLWQDSGSGYQPGRVYRLSVQAQGSRLTASLDGSPLFTVVDNSLADGGVGLYTWNNATATFARLWVLDLATRVAAFRVFDAALTGGGSAWRTRFGELQQRSVVGDPASPQYGTHAVGPLSAAPVMRLTVRARSDTDTPIGVVFRYVDENRYYRFSVSSADHVHRLIKVVDGTPSTLWELPGGYAPEVEHEFTVDTFGPRLVGHFDGERQFDLSDADLPAGRVGVYTSRNATAAFTSVRVSQPPVNAGALFVDGFAQGDLSAWTFVSEATVDGPANWAVADGVLAQTSAAYRPPVDPADVAKRGLLALAGDLALEDVVVRARLGLDGAGAIGVAFRYRDEDNYYRFSTDRDQGYRRVVKVVGGVFTVLWEDAYTFEADHLQEFVIVAAGERIWGYLDRVAAFMIDDADLASGRIGLYCWRNSSARSSSITVLPIDAAAAGWAFKDDFPYLVRDRWSFVDAGDVGAPSAWDVANRTLAQTSAISGDRPWKGTYAASAEGSREWQKFRVVAGVTTPGSGAVGVAARYLDPHNHYRFEVGAGSGRRLAKVVAGEETELWSDTTGYPAGAPLVISVECVDERLHMPRQRCPSVRGRRRRLYAWTDRVVLLRQPWRDILFRARHGGRLAAVLPLRRTTDDAGGSANPGLRLRRGRCARRRTQYAGPLRRRPGGTRRRALLRIELRSAGGRSARRGAAHAHVLAFVALRACSRCDPPPARRRHRFRRPPADHRFGRRRFRGGSLPPRAHLSPRQHCRRSRQPDPPRGRRSHPRKHAHRLHDPLTRAYTE